MVKKLPILSIPIYYLHHIENLHYLTFFHTCSQIRIVYNLRTSMKVITI